MPRSRRPKSSEEYYSFQHPDFRSAEWQFILAQYAPPNPPKGPGSEHYWADLAACEAALSDSRTADEAVFRTIKEHGPVALRPEQTETDEERAVRDLVWSHIERWRELVTSARTPAVRKRAAQYLRRIGLGLVPERRGKGKEKGPDPEAVCIAYYRTLFRLYRALELFEEWPWLASPRDKLRHVLEACRLQLDAVPPEWLDDDGALLQIVRRWPEQRVQELTADQFGIKPETVSNILSRMRHRRSRK